MIRTIRIFKSKKLFFITIIILFIIFLYSIGNYDENDELVIEEIRSFEDRFNYALNRNYGLHDDLKTLIPLINNYTINFSTKSSVGDCPKDLVYVILVMSSAWNFERRASIRTTWGYDRAFKKRWKTIFVIGINEGKPRINNQVIDEMSTYDDIILCGECIETYEVLPIKVIASLNWIINNCPSMFIIKVDDDVFINQYRLLEKINSIDEAKNYWAGHLVNNIETKGIRGQILARIPNRMSLGEYCGGAAYIISYDLIYKILLSFDKYNYFHLEDIMIAMIFKGSPLKNKLNSIDQSLFSTINHYMEDLQIECQGEEYIRLFETESKFNNKIIIQHPCDYVCQIQLYKEMLRSLKLF